MEINETLDTRGMLCPMPVLETAKKVKAMNNGEVLEILADDEGAVLSGCGTCGRFRGVGRKDKIEGATVSGLATLTKFIKEADRFITFGY